MKLGRLTALLPFLCVALAACTGTTRTQRAPSNDAGQGGGGAGQGGGGGSAGSQGGSAGTAGGGTGGGAGDAWLTVRGNKIVHADGRPFRVKGVNLHDTRSCDACTWRPPNPNGLMKWADEAIDNWSSSFIRFLLWAEPSAGGRTHWRSLVEDDGYYRDIQTVVNHITSKGTYVMVTLFRDPSQVQSGARAEWPTEATLPAYRKLAEAFHDNPRVLFALMNEPHAGESDNADLAAIFNRAIDEIRAVERARGARQHIVVAQAPQEFARKMSYWLEHPLTAGGGTNIAYEVHAYYPPSWFDDHLIEPARELPIIVGEVGPFHDPPMSEADALALMRLAEDNDIPYAAWAFHQRCEPNMLQDTGAPGYDDCGLAGAGVTFTWQPTGWGSAVKAQLARPWGE